MINPRLARDYLERAGKRLQAQALLLCEEAFADVVRESQEAVGLLLKGLLRNFGIAVPLSHDLFGALTANAHRLPAEAGHKVGRWSEIFGVCARTVSSRFTVART